jgi:hypothetical protein
MQLSIETVDQSGGCAYGYSCAYTDSISWATPEQPLPMIRDPRAIFDSLFGVGATPAERAVSRRADKSILDWVSSEVSRLSKDLGASDKQRLNQYLTEIREIERRIQKIEAQNSSGEVRELPDAPVGVPDDFAEHVKLMFDLQVLGLRVGHDPRVLVQDGPRRLGARLSRRAASAAHSTPRRTTASARSASPTS